MRGKAKPYNTINGRSVVVKDNLVYTNKGTGEGKNQYFPYFSSLRVHPRPIRRPSLTLYFWAGRVQKPHARHSSARRYLVFRHGRAPIMADILHLSAARGVVGGGQHRGQPSCPDRASGLDADVHMNGDNNNNSSSDRAESVLSPRKKDIKSFHELLNHFPAIARQMQPGLEKILREFTAAFERPLPPPPSSTHIPDPEPDGPSSRP